MSELPKGWVETTLEKVINIYSGKIRPKQEGSFPVYGGNGILNYGDKFNQEGETIIVGRVGAYCGNVFYETEKFWLSDNALGVKANGSSFVRFLYYKLVSMKLNNHAIGGAQPLLTQTLLKELEINLPTLPEQKAIAAVLSAFDDKIELLREQNQTLETLAQTIFKEWFVHFNFPGKDGKPYRDNGGEMVDSELGEIPKGWRVGKLGNVLELLYGKPLKTEDRTGSGFPVFGSNGVVGYHEKYLVEGPGIIVGRKGSMGEVVWSNNCFYPIDTTFYVSNLLEMKGLFYHYFLLKKYDFEKIGSDSAVPGLNRNAVYVIELVVPSLGVIEKFNTICESIFKKLKNNTAQIQTLAKARDTLLPKLMSGETRVKGFEQ